MERSIKMNIETLTAADHTEGKVSATLQMMGNKHASVFDGQWAPTLLILGLYNKLVKQLGSDYSDRRASA
jgi:hypothetical protein